jgi:four helix bundle protein
MRSKPEELRDRTKKFALRIIRLFRALPYRTDTQVLGKQLLRCGTSVAANYRAVCRARSKAEFIARIAIVAEDADEASTLDRIVDGIWNRETRIDERLAERGQGIGSDIDRLAADSKKDSVVRFSNYSITKFPNTQFPNA